MAERFTCGSCPGPEPHPKECRIVFSTDHGETWQQADRAFLFKDGLSIPAFLNFCRDYDGARDEFIYSYFIEPQWGPANPTVTYEENWGEGHVEISAFSWSFPTKRLSPDGTGLTMVFAGKNTNDSWNTALGRFVKRKAK